MLAKELIEVLNKIEIRNKTDVEDIIEEIAHHLQANKYFCWRCGCILTENMKVTCGGICYCAECFYM
jgi:late competence protein required for DNA uptake (superfamily II DNA/RNA helicase)